MAGRRSADLRRRVIAIVSGRAAPPAGRRPGGGKRAASNTGRSAVLDEPFMDFVEDVVRILVVEDEPRLAELIRRGLVAEGFVVQLAGGRSRRTR